jgi:hypothetical protein
MLALSGLWTEKRRHLTAWWERVKARPTFETALFKYVPPGLGEMMGRYGREAWPAVKAIVQQGD